MDGNVVPHISQTLHSCAGLHWQHYGDDVGEHRRWMAGPTPECISHFHSTAADMLKICLHTEAPVNGYAPLLHCDRIHLSSTVLDDTMAAAWSLLKVKYPSVPEELMAITPRHHAMLAYLCQVRSFRNGTCWTLRCCV